MPPAARPLRRQVTNENEEVMPRVTRAKAAALHVVPEPGLLKKPLQNKRSNTQLGDGARKRTALVDVSNVPKGGEAADKDAKKIGLAKAAHPSGVTKPSRVNSTRSILGAKDKNELKRPASGAASGNIAKKRLTTSASKRKSKSLPEDDHDSENTAPDDDEVEVVTEIKKITTTADTRTVAKETHREVHAVDPARSLLLRQQRQDIEELDREDEGDPLMVGEYVYEILDYMRELEITTAPNASYMDHQTELQWSMRGVLVDWLLEVHTRFHLLPETFYLAINIIDRFLSAKHCQLERLQLVGVAALFIASKYEEVLSPHIGNFSNVADDGFTDAEILSAERFILQALKYDLSFPNPMHFMRRCSKADGYDIQTRTLAKYLLEMTVLDHRFLHFLPSLNAAAAMHLSRIILDKGPWDHLLEHYSGYEEEYLLPTVHTMIQYLQGPVMHEAFYKKYAAKKYLKASLHARAWAKKYTGDLSEALQKA